MRGGGGFNFLRGRGTLVLAWISWGLALGGGSAIASTFIGRLIGGFVGIFPGWVAVLLFTLGAVGMFIDLLVDGVPNRLAIWMAIVLPSVARAVPGKLSATFTNLSSSLLSAINQWLGEWVGTTATLGVAVATVGVALLIARRVVAKGGM